MTNKQIANHLADLAAIMELHGENIFKIRSYQNAYVVLRKLDKPLAAMLRSEMDAIKGVGKAIGDKIEELLKTGELQTYKKYADMTPPGVIEMLNINGFGPKKVFTVWKDLGVETLGELLYACNENRLIEIRGFGKKTQDELIKNIQYYLRNADSQLWSSAERESNEVVEKLLEFLPASDAVVVGEVRRKLPTVRSIDVVVTGDFDFDKLATQFNAHSEILKGDHAILRVENFLPLHVFKSEKTDLGKNIFLKTGSDTFVNTFLKNFENNSKHEFENEKAVFDFLEIDFIEPELRESADLEKIFRYKKI